MSIEKLVVVKRATALEGLLRRFATAPQVKFYLESRGDSFSFYLDAHTTYKQNLAAIQRNVPRNIRSQIIDKEDLATFSFGEKDLIVVVGDDGLLVNVAKYAQGQPIIAVNADPQRFDGVLATCRPEEFPTILKGTLIEEATLETLTMAEACADDGQILYALNDFFIGKKDHTSARYVIEYAGEEERQSSSGIIIATGTGSTGWLTSVIKGSEGIAREILGEEYSIPNPAFQRSAPYLMFIVREPFPSKVTGTSIVYGQITTENPLKVTSNMPENGVIFSDGIQEDYLEFAAGKTIVVRPSEKKANVVRG